MKDIKLPFIHKEIWDLKMVIYWLRVASLWQNQDLRESDIFFLIKHFS